MRTTHLLGSFGIPSRFARRTPRSKRPVLRPPSLLLATAMLLASAAPAAFAQDCNSNGAPDADDIASGFSADCNENGKPDECDRSFTISTVTTAISGGTSVFASDLDGDGDIDVLSASANDDKIAWYENIDGSGVFSPQQVITTSADDARSVFAADMDSDGDIDVLSASYLDDKIAWYENIDGSGAFGPQQIITTSADGAHSVFAADLDGDKDMDVLSASTEDDKVAWYENEDGSGAFGAQLIITTSADYATSVFAADLDGDGDEDVLSASKQDHKIAWYENEDGTDSFSKQQIISTMAYSALSVFSADLDGDGDRDVVSAAWSGNIAWYENEDGAGSFGPQQVITNSPSYVRSVFAADLDSDGDRDVFSVYTGFAAWYENLDGAGAFGPQQIVETVSVGWSGLAADLDGDGDNDMLSASSGYITWYENKLGASVFGPQSVITASGCGESSLFVADLDGDGDNDLLSASPCDSAVAWYENEDGSGAFGTAQVITASAPGLSIFAVDLDGDGDNDVLSAHYDGISWYENDGSGAFDRRNNTVTPSGALCVFAEDLDGDGDVDVLSVSYAGDTVAWYENTDGFGRFGPQQIIATLKAADSVFAADLDGDGDQDVLSATLGVYTGGRPAGGIAWYENESGTGAFGSSQVIALTANGVRSVSAVDLDNDGDDDVLSASHDDDTIAWYENEDGAGVFGPQQVISTSANGAQCVFAADLDGDADEDVLSASAGDDKIAWYKNEDGSGSFGPQLTISTTAHGARSVFAADLDGDGDADVQSVSAADDKVAWYENEDGTGTFGPPQVVTAAAYLARSAFAVDLDGDGDNDVLSASFGDNKIAWYQNVDGSGQFSPSHVITYSAEGAQSVYAADLDGDGDHDVLSASSEDDKIAWYQNLDGLGSFGPQQVITTLANGARGVFAADLDGDGDTDVLSASGANSGADNKIAWYKNLNGLGAFGTQNVLSTSAWARSVYAADLDGDGDNDVVSGSSAKVAWYKNLNGSGFFGPQLVITTAVSIAFSVFAADVDGDGDNDVLSASGSDGKIAWYENLNGSDQFGPQRVITTSAHQAHSVFAKDLDGDSDNDVLSASAADHKIAWYENQDGLGAFRPQQVITTLAAEAYSVFAADLDGDGDADALSASSCDSKIAWYPLCYNDCNTNGVPDAVDIANCEPESGQGCEDCNLNSIPDSCDIAGQHSEDRDRNGLPDECEACDSFTDCADVDGDGIRDAACLWHECAAAFCAATDKTSQADIGDLSGACPPDGVCDGGDRFHALNCFANSTSGVPPYLCEDHAPFALNVDAGGPAICILDGVCDGNDVFHALNCFSNVNFQGQTGYPCTCPSGGPGPSSVHLVPDQGQVTTVHDSGGSDEEVVKQVGLILRGPKSALPGDLISVDIHLARGLKSLRGYQLHLGVSGGQAGRLELIDISIREPSVFSALYEEHSPHRTQRSEGHSGTARRAPTRLSEPGPSAPTAAAWSAFNISTHQMLAGLEAPQGVPAPAGVYLATFTYRVAQDAAGTFTIELLHDASRRTSPVTDDRTFLFGDYGGLIDVTSTTPLQVTVQEIRSRAPHSADHRRVD